MSESARLRLPFLAAAQAQKHVTHNEALVALDTLVQLSVLDKDLSAPPGSPAEGDCYLVAASATGAWTGWDGRIARYEDGDWRSFLPGAGGGAGWLAFVQDEGALYVFDGADWVPLASGGGSGEANTASNLGSTSGRQGVFAAKSGVDLRFKSLVATGGLSLSADANEVTVDGAAKVGTARTIGTAGLASGGGDLSADRTITVPIASQAEAEVGSDNTKAMTPLRTAEAIAALAPGGGSGEANTASNLGSTSGRQGVFASKSGVDLRFKSLVATGGLSLSADANEVTVDGAAKVGTARSIGTAGLASGGGDLSADRTITVPIASQAEAEAGSDNTKAMTPLRTAEAIAALAPGGGSGEANTASNLGSTSGRQGVFASKSGVDLRFKSLVATGGLSLSADANEVTVDGAAKVGTARTIGTAGLASGGGDLSADRTITVPIASQAEAEAGSDNTKAMTPLRVAQAIAELAPGGGPTLLASWTYSSTVSAVDLTGIPAGYAALLVLLVGVSPTTTAGAYMRASINNGVSFLTGSTDYTISPGGTAPSDAAQFDITATTVAAGEVVNAVLRIDGYALAGYKMVSSFSKPTDTAEARLRVGTINTSSAIDALRIYMSAGNLDAGTIQVYGL